MINMDRREGVVMAAHDVIAFNEVGGQEGVFVTHGEVIAYRKYGKIKFRTGQRNQLHVESQCGVARVVKTGIFVPENKTHGVAAVAVIRQHTGVYGRYQLECEAVQCELATGVHAVTGDSEGLNELGHDVIAGDDGGAGLSGNLLQVFQVVGMTVRQEDVIRVDVFCFDVLRYGVSTDEGIQEDLLSCEMDHEARMAEIL